MRIEMTLEMYRKVPSRIGHNQGNNNVWPRRMLAKMTLKMKKKEESYRTLDD
jgi:hypothetical protein